MAEHDTVEGLHRALSAIVDAAPRDQQMALLNAHPDLAGRLAIGGGLTRESSAEQASAGLDRCTPEEFRRFTELNDAYKRKFPFPFIMAVKGKSRVEILKAFEHRIHNTEDAEFRTALAEVHKIALLRLRDL
jgi:OHCU decarboxylase